jgi:hypothetical protein
MKDALTPFEARCTDLDAKDWNPKQIAAVLEVGEGAVRQALRIAALKMAEGRAEAAEERRSHYVESRRDIEAAALNYRTEETPRCEVVAGEVRPAEPLRRWVRWPFRDQAPQAG